MHRDRRTIVAWRSCCAALAAAAPTARDVAPRRSSDCARREAARRPRTRRSRPRRRIEPVSHAARARRASRPLSPDGRRRRAQEQRLRQLPPRTSHDLHAKATVHLGCSTATAAIADCPTRTRPTCTRASAGLADLRQPGPLLHAAQPRIARVHPLRQPRRPARRPHQLRHAGCHPKEVLQVRKSMMTHGCMLWGAALYNNGAVPLQAAALRRKLQHERRAAAAADRARRRPSTRWPSKGVVPYLDPLPRFEMSQPGNILRIFERGGRFRPEIGIPERLEEPGRPRTRLSDPRPGHREPHRPGLHRPAEDAAARPDAELPGHQRPPRRLPLQRLHRLPRRLRQRPLAGPLRPVRQVRQPRHWPAATADPTIPKDEPGHPIEHRFTTAIPTSQCIVCHIHPGTNVMNSYLGYMWWDEETDGELMYPARAARTRRPRSTPQSQMTNPDEAAARGLLGRPGVPGARRRAEPASPGTRSSPTSTATAGCSAPSSRRTARATCSTTTATSSSTSRTQQAAWPPSMPEPQRAVSQPARDRAEDPQAADAGRRARSSDGAPGAPDGHPPGKGHALHRLPLRPGRARQHASSTAKCGPRSRSSASTATARSTSTRRCERSSGPACRTRPAAETADDRGRDLLGAAHAVRQAAAVRGPHGRPASSRTRWSRRTCAGR